jgi:hypothetical protein
MSGKVNAFAADVLELVFLNTNIGNIGDTTGLQGSSSPGSLYVVLFTADPGDAGSVANEATYGGYSRKAVARGSAQWTVTGQAVSNDNAIVFDTCTSGTNTITHAGIAKSGTTSTADLLYHAPLNSSLDVTTGIAPQIIAGALTITEG